jgi:hypothetical protein
MTKLLALALAGTMAAAGAAIAEEIPLIDGIALGLAGQTAAVASDQSIALGSLDVTLKTVNIDNSIRQIAIMKDDVTLISKVKITGSQNFNMASGNGNGSISGGLTVSAVGAANSISTTVTTVPTGGRHSGSPN